MAWKKQNIRDHTKEGKLFDKDKSKKIKSLFESDKVELTEYELAQVLNKIIEGKKHYIDPGELQNLLMIIQEVKIKTLSDTEAKNLADYIQITYAEPEIYRYLKFAIYNQVSRHDDDMKDIITRLGLADKQYNYTLDSKVPLEKYLSYFDQDFIKKYSLDKDLEGSSEAGNSDKKPEGLTPVDGQSTVTNVGGTQVVQVGSGGLTMGLGANPNGGFVLTDGNGNPLPEAKPGETHIVGVGNVKQENLIDVLDVLSGGKFKTHTERGDVADKDDNYEDDDIEIVSATDFGITEEKPQQKPIEIKKIKASVIDIPMLKKDIPKKDGFSLPFVVIKNETDGKFFTYNPQNRNQGNMVDFDQAMIIPLSTAEMIVDGLYDGKMTIDGYSFARCNLCLSIYKIDATLSNKIK